MKKLGILFCLLSFALSAFAQFDKWEIFRAYRTTEMVEETNNYVFAVADSSLYVYGKEDQSLTTYSRKNGLSDNKIKALRYHASSHTLVIAYNNGNIDLWGEDGIYNLPYLKNNTSIQNKSIHDIYFSGDRAYLSAEVGIVVVNLARREIADTYRIGSVRSVCILEGRLYALTSSGIRQGMLTDNLLDNGNWTDLPLYSDQFTVENIGRIADFQNKLCLYVPKNGVYYRDGESIRRLLYDVNLSGMKVENERLMAFSQNTLYVSTNLSGFQTISGLNSLRDASYLHTENTYWLACGTNGLIGIQKNGGSYSVLVDGLTINSPKSNYAWELKFHDGRLWVTGGGRWLDRYWRRTYIMYYEDGQWANYDEMKIQDQTGLFMQDALNVEIDPADPNHIWVAYYGDGVLEMKGDTVLNWYNSGNSALETSSTSSPNRYVRVGGITRDADGNLWMTNCNARGSVKVLTPEGEWISYDTEIVNAPIIDKVLITSKGLKFVNLQHATNVPGLYVFDDNGTIADQSDDVSHYYPTVSDSQGNVLSATQYFSVVEDKEGNIWAGTNIGPIVCYNTSNVENLRFNRIVLADESDYLLNGVRVNCIAVDGSNQKWIGTNGSGVFLVNADGTEVLENFTTDNSPLPSNTINSIAIDPQTGKVFFAVDGYGVLSYQGEATEGAEDYSHIHAYPNPVRPDFNDKVIITGLMANSTVKITDVAGNLIYQTRSVGGQVSWDCRNAKGRRVATGIYLVLAATEEGGESVVTKIMVIK